MQTSKGLTHSDSGEVITLEEAVLLGAEDADFYGRFWFPKACRQSSPDFHTELDQALDSPENRHVAAKIFRGGAKTTKVRIYLSKRVAYLISRTIIIVGKSQDHACRSVGWLMRAVEHNHTWAETFGLRKGSKWTESEIEILAGADSIPIRVIALGITGSTRGINIDDYRPDLILVDDPCDEENTATPEQRKKISDLFFGALDKSLAPRSEAPHAKMVLLQTVLNNEDLISLCCRDPHWLSLEFGCFDDAKQSRWPERWSTEELLADKQAHIDRNQLSLWLREMECKIVSEEGAAFTERWLRYWDQLPTGGIKILCCDPTPPPADPTARSKITSRHDDCVIMMLQVTQEGVYVVDYWYKKAPDEEEVLEKFFEMWLREKGGVHKIRIETILFQRLLKRALEKKMNERRQYLTVEGVEDRRPKPVRIRQEISSVASHGRLFVHSSQGELIEQFISYPDVLHDDFLDCLTIGLTGIESWMYNVIDGEFEHVEDLPELEYIRGAP